MRTHRHLCGLLALGLAAAAVPAAETVAKPEAKAGPAIEVCFVLDTTGSMGGLLEGAKRKIWSIANQLLSAKPTPRLKVALVAYRDRGDAYITQRFDLTDDLDAVYGNLSAFQAGGGGDTPESVNQALDEAVNKITWSDESGTYRVIFLVGDCPPHMDYADDVKYPVSITKALGKDVLVNTVQCGNYGDTVPIWQDIAKRGEGRYVQIDQNGGMTAIATPWDVEIAKLNGELGKTVVAYGSARQQTEVAGKLAAAGAAPAAVAADRGAALHTYAGREGGAGAYVTGAGDLVQDLSTGKVDLSKLKDEELPPAMQKMTPAERAAYVKQQTEQRGLLMGKLGELNKQRQTFVDAETKRLLAAGKGDSFDQKVLETITTQAARKGIHYGQQ